MQAKQSQILISALRFQFLPDDWGRRFDNIPFYISYIRTFLAQNTGKAVWVKGGVVEREAYLIYNIGVRDKVVKILTKALRDGARAKVTPVTDPNDLIGECIAALRLFVGCLDLGSSKIGSYTPSEEKPSSLLSPIFLGGCRYDFKQCFETTRTLSGETLSHDKGGEPEVWLHLLDVVITNLNNPNYREVKSHNWLRKNLFIPCIICGSNPTDTCGFCEKSYCALHIRDHEEVLQFEGVVK